MDADGSNPTELVEAGMLWLHQLHAGPHVVPGRGQHGAERPRRGPFTASLDEGAYGLYVVNADGTGLRLVAKGANGSLAWRPVP